MSNYLYDLKTTFKVFKIFAANIGTFDNFNFKQNKGAKGAAKTIFMILLLLYCFGIFFFMFGTTMLNIYTLYSLQGIPERMPLTAITMVFAMTLFFGFVSVASNYYTGHGEEFFISMPLKPMCIFGGKFGVSFITDSLYGFLMICISGIIYGLKQGTLKNPLLYIGFITTGITVSLAAILFIYLIFIVILLVFKKLRTKKFLSAVATVFILVFALGYGLLSGGVSSSFNAAEIQNNNQFVSIANKITELSDKMHFLSIFSNAYNGNIISILVEIAICAMVVLVLVPVLSPAYIKTLNGFSDVKTKKIDTAKADEILKKETKAKSILNTLIVREIKTIFREPVFFTNGPMIVFLFPVIIIFSVAIGIFTQLNGKGFNVVRNELISDVTHLLSSPENFNKYYFYLILIIGGMSTFIGNMSNVAATCFSREGKGLYDLKSMPIDYNTIILAKFLHAMFYPVISGVIMSLALFGVNIFLGNVLTVTQWIHCSLMGILVSICTSILLVIFGMLIDTANPKLNWENPMVAFKQNINTLFSFLIDLAGIGLFIALALVLLPKSEKGIIILCWAFVAISAPIGRLYWKYAVKKIPLM